MKDVFPLAVHKYLFVPGRRVVGGREKVIGLNKLGERVIQWEPGENYWPGLAWLGLPGAPLGSLLVTEIDRRQYGKQSALLDFP